MNRIEFYELYDSALIMWNATESKYLYLIRNTLKKHYNSAGIKLFFSYICESTFNNEGFSKKILYKKMRKFEVLNKDNYKRRLPLNLKVVL